jgi:hypothetical protein
MEEKVYLFNSGFRPLYRQNIHKILALPDGFSIQMRYSSDKHVPKDIIRRELTDLSCLIIYIDRSDKAGYVYYPIRKGKILSVGRREGYLFVEVMLGKYVHTTNANEFTINLQNKIKNIPKKQETSSSASDGYYIQIGQDVTDYITSADESWFETVKNISNTTLLKDDKQTYIKLALTKKRGGKEVLVGKENLMRLKSKRRYELKLSYCNPDTELANKKLICENGSCLKFLSNNQIILDGYRDDRDIPFETNICLRSTPDNIGIAVKTSATESKLPEYTIELPVSVSPLSLQLTLYAIVFVVAIILKETVFKGNDLWSTILEATKWLLAYYAFVQLGSKLP